MRSWLSVLITDAESKKVFDIPIAPSLYSLSNKMDNSLLAVRDINHKYIVVESIKLSSGKFRIGIEIPEGEYLICPDEKSFFLYNKLQIYNARGTELKPIFLNSTRKKKIKLKDGYVLKAQSSFWISI